MNKKLKHIGVIIDGNRRWAKRKGLSTLNGHKVGYDNVKNLVDWCLENKIEIVTVYAFSTENWNRKKEEVNYLMKLLLDSLAEKEINNFYKKEVKLRVIGQKEKLNKKIQNSIKNAETKTTNNNKLIFNLAISYGGRPEILQAVKKIIKDKIKPEKISEETINQNLWTSGLDYPDIIIRSGGEKRLSNFLTWQSAYSELFFIDKFWPDFNENDFNNILKEYYNRERRFGK